METLDEANRNTDAIIKYFNQHLEKHGERGDIGFAKFSSVFNSLMPIQQSKLRSITSGLFEKLYNCGTIVSIGVAYSDPSIDYINTTEDGKVNYDLWNEYALEYHRLNQILNQMAKDIASEFDGIALTATIGGVIEKVKHVREYFEMVISHRAVAEQAGVGWRGKNQLLIHKKYSCAIRFSSVILSIPLTHGTKMVSKCEDCSACEDVCSFIRNRDTLPDYRENCRRYILHLKRNGIEKDICGKCIKACYRRSLLKEQFDLSI